MGLNTTSLNAIIAVILIAVTFSTGFFIYSSFVNTLNKNQATKGFDLFIQPVRDVCSGKDSSLVSDVSLPLSDDYTYGVFQARLRSYNPSMPVVMRKCVDSYCLCSFRLRKPSAGYDFWDINLKDNFWFNTKWLIDILHLTTPVDDNVNPAPLWFFKPAGISIFPSLSNRMISFTVYNVVEYLVVHKLVPYLISDLTCESVAGSANPAAIAACRAAMWGVITGSSEAAIAFVKSLVQEASEPFILVNYPSFFMTNSNPNYLYWNSDGGCDSSTYCDANNNVFYKVGITQEILSSSDWQAAGFNALQGFIDGFISGITASFTPAEDVTPTFSSRIAKQLSAGSLSIINSYAYFNLQETAALMALDFDIPESLRPSGYIKSLLGIRRVMPLDEFISTATFVKKYDYSFDDSLNTFSGFDVINCVAINDLGPNCDGDTKVLMDYSNDMFFSYRVTDPINNPAKAIFCGYTGESKSFDFNVLELLLNPVFDSLKEKGIDVDFLRDVIIYLTNLFIGDWLLAGMTSMQGLFTECITPYYDANINSEYFQYWVMGEDSSGLIGYNGRIPALSAYLVDTNEGSCKQSVIDLWNNCLTNYRAYVGVNPFAESDVASLTAPYQNLKFTWAVVCPVASDGVNCDYDGDWSDNITCYNVYKPKLIKCLNGVHIIPLGVIQ